MNGLIVARMRGWILAAAMVTLGSHAYTAEALEKQIDAEAEEILRQFSDEFAEYKSFDVDIELTQVTTVQGQSHRLTTIQSVAAQRPERYAVRLKDGEFASTLVSDGETVSLAFKEARKVQYSTRPVSATPTEHISNLEYNAFRSVTGGTLLVEALLSQDPHNTFVSGLKRLEYGGKETIGGVECHRLKAVEANEAESAWELWFNAGESPLPQMLKLDTSNTVKQLQERLPPGTEMRMVISVDFVDWKFDTEIPEERFRYTPLPNAKKIGEPGSNDASSPTQGDARLGQALPPMQLDVLDGASIDLASHIGQEVVVLDLWATWCAPCRGLMPIVSRIAQDYREKDVAVYAVNIGETAPVARGFIKSERLELNVLLDTENQLRKALRVSSIPQTFVIGLDGTIQAVHVGLTQGYDRKLREELDTLLSGTSLVEPAGGTENR